MRCVGACRLQKGCGVLFAGLAAAITLHAPLCVSAPVAAMPAGHGHGTVLSSTQQAYGSWSGSDSFKVGGSACDSVEDSLHEQIQLHTTQIDELMSYMSQFQVACPPLLLFAELVLLLVVNLTSRVYLNWQERAASLAGELERRSTENDRLVAALEAGGPSSPFLSSRVPVPALRTWVVGSLCPCGPQGYRSLYSCLSIVTCVVCALRLPRRSDAL